MGIRIVSAPALEPISLTEAKLQCNIDTSDFDTLLALFISAARAKAEAYTGAVIMQRTVDHTIDEFPADEDDDLRIGVIPAWHTGVPVAAPVSIESITYVDEAGALQTLSPSLYVLDDTNWPLWILPAFDEEWPATREQANAVTIRLQVGYISQAQVPADLRGWLLMTVAFMFAQRESVVVDGKVAEIPNRWTDALLDPYRVFEV